MPPKGNGIGQLVDINYQRDSWKFPSTQMSLPVALRSFHCDEVQGCIRFCKPSCVNFRRILIKGAAVLDLLYGCKSIGLDKTGTLTKGNLTCTAIMSSCSSDLQNGSLETSPKSQSLTYAVALSQRSTHPAALAIKRVGEQLGVSAVTQINQFELVPGAGVRGTVTAPNGVQTMLNLGSIDFIKEALPKAQYDRLAEEVSGLGKGKSVSVLLEQSGGVLEWTVFSFEDQIRANSAKAVAALRMGTWKSGSRNTKLEKRVVMLTGNASSTYYAVPQTRVPGKQPCHKYWGTNACTANMVQSEHVVTL